MARKVLIYLGALVCASAVGAVAWSSADRETAPMERGTIVAAQRGPIESTVSAFGRFEPSVEAQVSQLVAGRIGALTVRAGDRVTAGQVVAMVEAPLQELSVEAVESRMKRLDAVVRQREAEARLARQTRDTAKPVDERGRPSPEVIGKANAELAVAEALLAQAQALRDETQAELRREQVLLDHARISSPIDGTVLEIHVRAVEYNDPENGSNKVMLIGDTDQLLLKAMVSEADVLDLHPGMAAQVTLVSDPDMILSSTVSIVRPQPQEVNGAMMYVVELPIANTGGRLKPGMTARARFVTSSDSDAVIVPRVAVGMTDNGPAVAIPAGDGFELRAVETGIETRSHKQITSGLSAGQPVIVPFPKDL